MSSATTSSSLYDVLGVARTASAADIRRAFRKLALEHHPDRNPPEKSAEAAAAFKRVNAAYRILSDPAKRADYDRTLESSGPAFKRAYKTESTPGVGGPSDKELFKQLWKLRFMGRLAKPVYGELLDFVDNAVFARRGALSERQRHAVMQAIEIGNAETPSGREVLSRLRGLHVQKPWAFTHATRVFLGRLRDAEGLSSAECYLANAILESVATRIVNHYQP